jgi:hypothetical protein
VPEDEVLFELPVSKRWLRQEIVALTLICRNSYRGVVEFMRDLLGRSTSVGNVHDVQQWAAQQCVRRKSKLAPAQLFHAASPSGCPLP